MDGKLFNFGRAYRCILSIKSFEPSSSKQQQQLHQPCSTIIGNSFHFNSIKIGDHRTMKTTLQTHSLTINFVCPFLVIKSNVRYNEVKFVSNFDFIVILMFERIFLASTPKLN
ncbi:hypothetical protein BLOT_007511 [Blomia tropicalis]|nr:hypothetical protein BLOT_007511 [Blomia tropicalis]